MTIQETEKKKFKNISAQLTIDFFDRVKARAHALQISQSELVRLALTEFLNASEKVNQD